MDIEGTIKLINPTQSFGANNFLKREFVITTNEQYAQNIIIEMVQDKTLILDNFNVGQQVVVSINLRGREWINLEGVAKYFNTIQGWRIVAKTYHQPQQPKQHEPPVDLHSNEPDDLPF